MLEHVLDISGTSFLRQLDGLLMREVGSRRDEIQRRSDQFSMVEKSLVNGLLPDPSTRAANENGWIDTWHWDFLIGVHSTSTPGYPGLTYAAHPMAMKKCGLYQDLVPGQGINERKRIRREQLFSKLMECGLLEPEDEPPYRPELSWHRKMLVPTWPADSRRPIASGVVKTRSNLEQHNRDWFMMPEGIINDRTWFKAGNHTYRRIIAALYLFFDETTYSAVNPNHLRLTDRYLFEASDAFMRACGESADLEDVAGALSWLWNARRFFGMEAELEAGKPFPAGREYVTWSRSVARNVPSDTVVFVPFYAPAQGGTA